MEAMFQTIMDTLEQLNQRFGRIQELTEGRRKSNFTVQEVAKLTGRSTYTVRTHWIGQGLLRADKLNGGKLLIEAAELERFMASGRGSQYQTSSTASATNTTSSLRFGGPVRELKPYCNRVAFQYALEEEGLVA